MGHNLTMEPSKRLGGSSLGPSGEQITDPEVVVGYVVRGLPAGEEALISDFGASWLILRIKDGIAQGDWAGNYKRENEALEALQKEYDD